MRSDNPFHVFAVTPAVSFLLGEDYGFHSVACEDMPEGCDCGYLHLIPPVEFLADSEYLEQSEADELLAKVEQIRKSLGSEANEALQKLAIEVHELLDDRAAFEAAEMRAWTGTQFEDDPPPEFFATPPPEPDEGG